MPIHEFLCEDCCCEFESLVFARDPMPVCPGCSGQRIKKLISAGALRPNGIPTGGGGFKEPACKPSGGG